MPLAIWNGRAIFFAHVPKAGGTTIVDYMRRRFGPLSIVTPSGHVLHASHFSADELQGLLPANLDYCFVLVRDPVERAKSEYRFQAGYSWLSQLSFSTWLRVMARAVKIDPRVYENHIRPQSDLAPEAAESFRLEQDGISEIVARLDEALGEAAPEISPDHFLPGKQVDIALRREDLRLIEQMYAVDYERFGFDRPDGADLPRDRFAILREVFAMIVAPVVVWTQRLRWIRA